jgi:hypothetical protein
MLAQDEAQGAAERARAIAFLSGADKGRETPSQPPTGGEGLAVMCM